MKVIDLQTTVDKKRTQRCVSFTYNGWQLLFDKEFICFWFARIINECPRPSDFFIRGYLIQPEMAYLIMEGNSSSFRSFYHSLNKFTKVMLASYLRMEDNPEKIIINYFITIQDEKSPMYQIAQIRNSDYQNVLLYEPLIYKFHNYSFNHFYKCAIDSHFCSRIDYAGGTGPIVIDKIHETSGTDKK